MSSLTDPNPQYPTNLVTARYQDKQRILDDGLIPVGITIGYPRFRLPFKPVMCRLVAPTWDMVRQAKTDPGFDFDAAYRERLNEIGVGVIMDKFTDISAGHDGDPLGLLCFENVHAGERCHRRILAAWLEEQTGIPVPELKAA